MQMNHVQFGTSPRQPIFILDGTYGIFTVLDYVELLNTGSLPVDNRKSS